VEIPISCRNYLITVDIAGPLYTGVPK